MNQPTREEFEELREEQRQLKEEVRKLREQITEPIKVTRLEIDSGSMHELLVQANERLEQIIQTQTDRSEKFDALEHGQREISQKQDEQFNHLKAELESISTKQEEHAKGLLSHSRNINAFQDEMKEARADILKIRESQADFRDALQKTATKDDISRLEATLTTKDDIASIKATQDQILQLLRQKPGEG